MEYWYPYVIGTVAFFYIQSFNRIAKMYFESEKTLSWNEFLTKVVPIRQFWNYTALVGIEPTTPRLTAECSNH